MRLTADVHLASLDVLHRPRVAGDDVLQPRHWYRAVGHRGLRSGTAESSLERISDLPRFLAGQPAIRRVPVNNLIGNNK
jgi:hypothetical protein